MSAALIAAIASIVEAHDSREAAAVAVAEAIRRERGFRWVGLYDVEPTEVKNIAWAGSGPPSNPRFRVTAGLTSAAIASAEPVIVNDVASDPRYLEAFGDTRSEMIVPVLVGAERVVRGTIAVESDRRDAFSEADRGLLAACAEATVPLWTVPTLGGHLYAVPEGLLSPLDDGGCAHLPGQRLPDLTLDSSVGPINLAKLGGGRMVVYLYPRTGKPGRPAPPTWDAIPGARGCTPESCAFRDHAAELAAHGFAVAGLSAQALSDQIEFAERNGMPFPVIADPARKLGAALDLPTFVFEGATLYKRLTLVAEQGVLTRVFYPVFPPEGAAAEVLSWLRKP